MECGDVHTVKLIRRMVFVIGGVLLLLATANAVVQVWRGTFDPGIILLGGMGVGLICAGRSLPTDS